MTRTQRRVHAGVWTVLGAMLLAMLAIALVKRPEPIDAGAAFSERAP
jgi:hypothetical protein